MTLKEKVKSLPSCPGVYLMKDSLDNIIYVGKSKNLKNRVRSYFQNSKHRSSKIEKLVLNLKDFDYIVTDTEFEAFMLECKLIKEIKPAYNKLMKTPLSYTYIKITMDEDYPKIQVTNSYDKNNGCLYFGPYTTKNIVEDAMEGIKEFYKINCSNPSKKNSTCLNYSLGLCLGMCGGNNVKEKYKEIINKIARLLKGYDKTTLHEIEEAMNKAAGEFNFEVAAKYRDYLDAIKFLMSKEKVIEFTEANQNIVMIEYLNESSAKIFFIKGNKVLFSEKYNISNDNLSNNIINLKRVIKENILTYFNSDTLNSFIEVNRDAIDEAQIIYSYLKSNNCRYILIPHKNFHTKNHNNIYETINNLFS